MKLQNPSRCSCTDLPLRLVLNPIDNASEKGVSVIGSARWFDPSRAPGVHSSDPGSLVLLKKNKRGDPTRVPEDEGLDWGPRDRERPAA